MARDETHERIEEEASLWAARLDGGGMTDADRATLATWLAANPEHRWLLSRYRQLSAQLESEFDALVESATQARATARRRWRIGATGLAAAAVVAFTAIVATRGGEEFSTGAAERHVAALSDGSRIALNALTELHVDLGKAERHVRLTRGEAWFDVAPEKARPFVVETPAGVVRVTGTEFNIRARPKGAVEVTVLEGRVRVQPAAAASSETALEIGQQALVTTAALDVHRVEPGALQNVLAWREGQAVFEDTPLSEALERFAAYHGRTVEVDGRVADRRLGGRYSLDDFEGLLEEIERVLPVRVLRQPDGVVRVVPIEGR
ncbi:FecR family protein [Opitutus terrae]|uniref:Anti-FecI sigma factor, FecR n=1 Tax=Opitutus terrae (strain DSM 11246 / JCM 15787 / PB90-1) TaxID=452637 RepID=B1ZTJ9_OPITP|nr:FecR domain-containing protein [Opitutus terrae]ACB73944.1 anti-FecI sigma factor, FecR [Opitutus terrae PB90-1]